MKSAACPEGAACKRRAGAPVAVRCRCSTPRGGGGGGGGWRYTGRGTATTATQGGDDKGGVVHEGFFTATRRPAQHAGEAGKGGGRDGVRGVHGGAAGHRRRPDLQPRAAAAGGAPSGGVVCWVPWGVWPWGLSLVRSESGLSPCKIQQLREHKVLGIQPDVGVQSWPQASGPPQRRSTLSWVSVPRPVLSWSVCFMPAVSLGVCSWAGDRVHIRAHDPVHEQRHCALVLLPGEGTAWGFQASVSPPSCVAGIIRLLILLPCMIWCAVQGL